MYVIYILEVFVITSQISLHCTFFTKGLLKVIFDVLFKILL